MASRNRIRGITIEIGGDTTKLDRALAGSNKQISATSSALKDVERLLKMDPGNTELLAQKQRLLTQAVEGTSQKLNTLRQAAQNADQALQRGQDYQARYAPLKEELDRVAAAMRGLEADQESMQAQLESGQISTEQYDAFQRELEETRDEYETLKKAARDLEKEFAGARLTTEEYDALQRELIETELELRDLEEQAGEGSSALAEFSDAAGEVSTKAGTIKDAFAPVTAAISAVAAAALSTVPATEEFRADLSMLDNNARQAGVGIDVVRQAFSEFNTISGETDSSIETVSNLLQAGFTESNLQIAVEGLANAAATFPDTMKIESLADSLQETLATGEATGQFGELLDRIGYGTQNFTENLKYCTTEVEKQQLALSILVDGPLKGAYEGWQQNNQGLVQNREASLQLQIQISELAERVQPLVTQFTELAIKFLDWFNSLDEGTQRSIVGVGLLLAAISPVAGAVETVSGVLSKLDGISGSLGIRMGIVVAAIAALVIMVAQVAAAWDSMTGAEKVISILGLIAAAAVTAAIALGAFQSALTLGIAAAAIAAGIVAVTAAVNSATKRANQMSQQVQMPSGYSAGYGDIPGFASGGVVPPNQPFLAVLGDNRKEPEVVAPYSTIKQAAGEALSERSAGGTGVAYLYLDGVKLGRMMFPYIQGETTRLGVQLIGGRR